MIDVKELRLRRGWSQNDVAKLLNSSLGRSYRRGDVSQWERGLRKLPTPVSELLERIDQDDPDAPTSVSFEPPPEQGGPGDSVPPPPGVEETAATIAAVVGGGSYARVCEELWELVATGVGMVGAVTGSDSLRRDSVIILNDKAALGKAYGKLAEQNATFRNMLAGMTGSGAWLEVALVSGITAGKVMRNHQTRPVVPHVVEDEEIVSEPGVMHGDGAVVHFPA